MAFNIGYGFGTPTTKKYAYTIKETNFWQMPACNFPTESTVVVAIIHKSIDINDSTKNRTQNVETEHKRRIGNTMK